jgi:signal transduction histidine kinase
MKKQQTSHHFRVPVASSVQTRLTLWYVAMMAFIIIVVGGCLYFFSQTFLNVGTAESTLETQVDQDSQRFAALYSQALAQNQALNSLPLTSSSQEMVLLLHPDGSVLDARGPLTSRITRQFQTRAGQNTVIFELTLPRSHWWDENTTYHILLMPVLSQNRRIATLLVGLPLQQPVSFLTIWVVHGILALLVAALCGYWLAGKALQPVKLITRLANEISATDLRRRLHLQRGDEFGELAATFDRMLERLETAFQRLVQFTADASHELRTPLAIINLEVDRALTQCERPEDYRHVLEQVQAENEQMTAIVNSLLLLARTDTGQIELDLQVVDLADIALACVERLLPLARQRQITLAIGELPEILVRGDPHYLGQMLTNVIENGIKYSSGIGKRVHVELACEQGRWGVIHVRDDGPGIAEEHLLALFERFYRVDKARGRKQGAQEEPGGTGLGLSIVQWIVQAHGGEIRVKSKVGSGSLFEIRLLLLETGDGTAQKGPEPRKKSFARR